MTFRLLKSRRTTATARSWWTWTAASHAALFFFAVAAIAKGEPPTERLPAFSPSFYRAIQAPPGDRTRYLGDHTQIKNATLESEAVFFDRLEKQKKIEDVRIEVTFASQKIRNARFKLSPVLSEFDKVEQDLRRAETAVEAASKNLQAAELELRRFHDVASAEAAAIVSGKLDAAPLAARIRRMFKKSEQSLGNAAQSYSDAVRLLELARGSVTRSLQALAADSPRRTALGNADKSIEEITKALGQASNHATALSRQIDSIRREYLPDCLPSESPVIAPNSTNAHATRQSLLECRTASLTILNRSGPAIAATAQAIAQLAAVTEASSAARMALRDAVMASDKADVLAHAAHDRIRQLQKDINELLDQAEEQLFTMKHQLTADMPGETAVCTHCGDMVIRTRKILDPACICAQSNVSMSEVETKIRRARELAQQMASGIAEIPDQDESPTSTLKLAVSDIQGSEGVLDQLDKALVRSEEYRKQQFDLYPGESTPLLQQEMPKRDFPPMVATYVARQSWHYPVYFEDIALERYGHHHGCWQPLVSYGKFLTDLFLLPYNICLEPPHTVIYDMGLYRPGDEVPHLIYLPRPDCKAALFQAAVWTGLMFTP